MASVMGLLEARETAALVRVGELREEAERVLAELREAEAVLERRAGGAGRGFGSTGTAGRGAAGGRAGPGEGPGCGVDGAHLAGGL